MAMSGPPSARRGRGRAPMADINVTPLVDVMLVLLIIFMVTAPLLVTGVPVNLPETRAQGLDQDAKPTVVSIDQGAGLWPRHAGHGRTQPRRPEQGFAGLVARRCSQRRFSQRRFRREAIG